MNGSQYERELRGILEGEKKTLSKIVKTCSVLKQEQYLKICQKPFAVIRAAGSLGIDLVAVRGDVSLLIEIKSSSSDTLHFSTMAGKLQQQADVIQQLCQKTHTLPLYAFRLKNIRGDTWRLFTLDDLTLSGRLSIIHRRLPLLERSKKNFYIMRWKEGMSLSSFIEYITL